MLLFLIIHRRWTNTGYAQTWKARKRIRYCNGLWQLTSLTHSNSLLVSLSSYVSSPARSAAARALQFPSRCLASLSRAESLTTAFSPSLTLVVCLPCCVISCSITYGAAVSLRAEVVRKGERKAGRDWDDKSKQRCSSSSITLWDRQF